MNRKPIFGLGLNDLDYDMFSDNRHNLGQVWRDVIKRVASKNFHNKRPDYKYCTISDEWVYASNFVKWAESQDYKNKSIDKDIILIGNKHYSKENCCFVSSQLNSFMANPRQNSLLLRGVTSVENAYQSQISFKGNRYYLGRYKKEIDAHHAYRIKKAEFIDIFISDETDEKIIKGLNKHIQVLKDFTCII